MAKYKKLTEASKQGILDKLFYYLGRGMRPMVVRKMSKADPKFAKAWNELEKHKAYMDDLFDN